MLVFFNETTSNIIDVTVRGGEVVTIVCLAKRKQSIDMILEFVMTDEWVLWYKSKAFSQPKEISRAPCKSFPGHESALRNIYNPPSPSKAEMKWLHMSCRIVWNSHTKYGATVKTRDSFA
jgi:hypothetical protein